MDAPAIALLAVVVGVLLWRATMRERRDYARFKRLRSTLARQRVYRRWLVESILVMGGLSAAVLFAGWSQIDPALATAQEWDPLAATRDWLVTPVGTAAGIAVVVALAAALVLPVLLLRGDLDEVPALGDIRALLPRTPGELPYGAGLAIQAGILEELLFRLGIPALAYAATGNALLAFGGALVVFGLLHLYQGPVGLVFATLLGVVFTALYLVTGSILVAIALHLAIDLRSLVLIPVVLGKAHRPPAPRSGRPGPSEGVVTRAASPPAEDGGEERDGG
jgi:membrane protease YdiL (CAAX protease family)